MSNDYIERSIRLGSADSGHKDVLVVVTDAYAAMPVRICRGESVVHLRWSEWDEVRDHVQRCMPIRDHVERCMPMMKAESDEEYEYVVCNAMPGLVPYEALPCVLEAGHTGDRAGIPPASHCDRNGRHW